MIVGHSNEDTLVEWEQVYSLVEQLRKSSWRVVQNEDDESQEDVEEGDFEKVAHDIGVRTQPRKIYIKVMVAEHDSIWEEGTQIVRLIVEAVARALGEA